MLAGMVLAVGALSLLLLPYQQRHAGERREASYRFEQLRSANPPSECASTKTGFERFLCAAKVIAATQLSARDQSDLRAQQEMSEWTYALLLLAILGNAVTILGVVYVARTLGAAVQANEGFAQASQRELRPYVFPGATSANATWDDSVVPPVVLDSQFKITWKNVGQTPATRVRTWLSIKAFPVGTTPESIGFADLGTFRSPAAPLGPTQEFEGRVFVSMADLTACWQGTQDLYYWGWIEYDGLLDGVRHRTESCNQIHLKSDPNLRGPGQMSTSHFALFNGTDDDCLHQPKT